MAAVGGWSNVHMPSSARGVAGRTLVRRAVAATRQIGRVKMCVLIPSSSSARTLHRAGGARRLTRHHNRVVPIWLIDLFARYGYGVVFAGVLLENAGIPVPGETALLAGGALAHIGRLSFTAVVATAVTAAIVGDNIGFAIGRRGGR